MPDGKKKNPRPAYRSRTDAPGFKPEVARTMTKTMMVDTSDPAMQRSSSQYYTGALDSDDDGISVVEGTFVDSKATLKVSKDGIPVITPASAMTTNTYWQTFSDYLGVSLSGRQRGSPAPASRRWGLLPISSKSDDTSSVSSSDDGQDHTMMTSQIVSKMEVLQSVWSRESSSRRHAGHTERVPSPGLTPMAQATDVSEDESSLSVIDSVDDSLSSSAAAPYLSAASEDDETLFTASNHERLAGYFDESSFHQGSTTSFVSVSGDGLTTKEEVDAAMNKWLRGNILGEKVDLPGRTMKPIESLDTAVTERLCSERSIINDESATSRDSSSVGSISTTSTNDKKKRRRKRRNDATATSSRCSCLRWVCMIVLLVSLVMVVGIGLGIELWSREKKSDSSSQPMPAETDEAVPLTPMPSPSPTTPLPSSNEHDDAIPLFLRLSFGQPLNDVDAVASILETRLALKLSTVDGLLFVELYPKNTPHRSQRNLRMAHAVFVGNAVFGLPIDDDVRSAVTDRVCELLNDVDELQGALSQDPTLNGIDYQGPGWGDCSHDMSTASPHIMPTAAPSPGRRPTSEPAMEVSYRGSTTSMPTPVHDAPRPARPPTLGVTFGDQMNDSEAANKATEQRGNHLPTSAPTTE